MHRDSEGYFHKIKCVLYMPGKYGTESICWSAAVCTSLCQSISQLVSQSVSLSLLYSISLSMGQSVDQSVSQQLLLQSNIASVFQSISSSVRQFLLSMSHPQWFLSVCPSTHKTFIKQINPSYIHGHSLVIGSVSRLTVLSELNSFCLGTQDDFWGIP